MSFLPFLLPALTSVAGSIFSHTGQNSQINQQNANNQAADEAAQRARYDMGRNGYERSAAGQAVRGSLAAGVISHYLKNLGVDPALLSKISTPTAYPNFEYAPGQANQAGVPWSSTAGNFLSGIAPYIGLNQAQGQATGTPVGWTQMSPTGAGRGSAEATTPNTQYISGGGPGIDPLTGKPYAGGAD